MKGKGCYGTILSGCKFYIIIIMVSTYGWDWTRRILTHFSSINWREKCYLPLQILLEFMSDAYLIATRNRNVDAICLSC